MSISALIVDDEQDIRTLIRMVIKAANHGLVVGGEAADGEEALRVIDEQDPDIVILDQRMPGITGIETARRILSKHPDQKIVLCSAFLDSDLRHEAEAVGIKVCLAKGDIARIPQVMRDLGESA